MWKWILNKYEIYKLNKKLDKHNTTERALLMLVLQDGGWEKTSEFYITMYRDNKKIIELLEKDLELLK